MNTINCNAVEWRRRNCRKRSVDFCRRRCIENYLLRKKMPPHRRQTDKNQNQLKHAVLPSPAPAKLFACRDGGMFSSSSPRQDNHRLDDERRLVNSFVRSSLTSKQEPVVLIMDDDRSTPIPNLTILSLSMHRAMLLFAQAGNRADLCSYPGVYSAPLHRPSAGRNTCFSDKTPRCGTGYKWLLARRKTRRAKSIWGGEFPSCFAWTAFVHAASDLTSSAWQRHPGLQLKNCSKRTTVVHPAS